ncbi:hypothetical protein JOY44_28745 (plasmid) [Phormidium sp. CLA17]|uniref:hypothetical protein n=1 Tax=Leptolyngbya sp. Cla-17 TaxID=2803751 RepID=UPI001492AB9E|nr:hypothetical protein [Leptolyngbya sp. Cla-17]MBM0745416.1 hypothetical protein [Leptolyngbya sp. Cla-17]
MTGSRDKLYEEIYKGRLIEIDEFQQSMPGSVTASHFTVSVDGVELPGTFDDLSYQPFGASAYPKGAPDPEQSSALAAAKAYCDREAEAKD